MDLEFMPDKYFQCLKIYLPFLLIVMHKGTQPMYCHEPHVIHQIAVIWPPYNRHSHWTEFLQRGLKLKFSALTKVREALLLLYVSPSFFLN